MTTIIIIISSVNFHMNAFRLELWSRAGGSTQCSTFIMKFESYVCMWFVGGTNYFLLCTYNLCACRQIATSNTHARLTLLWKLSLLLLLLCVIDINISYLIGSEFSRQTVSNFSSHRIIFVSFFFFLCYLSKRERASWIMGRKIESYVYHCSLPW